MLVQWVVFKEINFNFFNFTEVVWESDLKTFIQYLVSAGVESWRSR